MNEYTNTLLNILEYVLNENQILFDEYMKDSQSVWLLSMPKLISDSIWTEQLRQRIKNQIEPLKNIDIEYISLSFLNSSYYDCFRIKDNEIYKRILEEEKHLQKKLDNFIDKTNQQWIANFQKQNFLHLNEPLLRKEDTYYLVNIKPEVIISYDLFPSKNCLTLVSNYFA